MQQLTRDEKLATWRQAEADKRETLAPVGVIGMAAVMRMTPAEFFGGIGAGQLPAPPMGALLDFVPVEWGDGFFVFQGTPDTRHYNPLGTVHGGYAATLLDSCIGCAIHTRLARGQGYTTTDLRVSYLRALTANTGPIRAEGRVIHLGRSTAIAEGRLFDVDDRLYAIGSATCLILNPPA